MTRNSSSLLLLWQNYYMSAAAKALAALKKCGHFLDKYPHLIAKGKKPNFIVKIYGFYHLSYHKTPKLWKIQPIWSDGGGATLVSYMSSTCQKETLLTDGWPDRNSLAYFFFYYSFMMSWFLSQKWLELTILRSRGFNAP